MTGSGKPKKQELLGRSFRVKGFRGLGLRGLRVLGVLGVLGF